MKLLSSVLVLSLLLGLQPAMANKRLGGGGSVGKQSAHVTPSGAVPAQPALAPGTSAQRAAQSAPAQAPAAAPAAASAASPQPWGAVLGGVAAGLGLAWLASSLGWGEAFGNVLLAGLLAMAVLAVVGAFLRNRMIKQAGSGHQLAYQGAAAGTAEGYVAKAYSPQNVGNDASARPWERTTTAFEADNSGAAPVDPHTLMGSHLPGTPSWGVPAGFDVDGFLRASKTNFVNLQAAWDRADIAQLRSMMTDDMLAQIQVQLADREQQARGAANVTEVVMLEARLLGIEEMADAHMASVEFSGMVREDPSAGPNPFREVWNITRPKTGPAGWLVAGVQALQ